MRYSDCWFVLSEIVFPPAGELAKYDMLHEAIVHRCIKQVNEYFYCSFLIWLQEHCIGTKMCKFLVLEYSFFFIVENFLKTSWNFILT